MAAMSRSCSWMLNGARGQGARRAAGALENTRYDGSLSQHRFRSQRRAEAKVRKDQQICQLLKDKIALSCEIASLKKRLGEEVPALPEISGKEQFSTTQEESQRWTISGANSCFDTLDQKIDAVYCFVASMWQTMQNNCMPMLCDRVLEELGSKSLAVNSSSSFSLSAEAAVFTPNESVKNHCEGAWEPLDGPRILETREHISEFVGHQEDIVSVGKEGMGCTDGRNYANCSSESEQILDKDNVASKLVASTEYVVPVVPVEKRMSNSFCNRCMKRLHFCICPSPRNKTHTCGQCGFVDHVGDLKSCCGVVMDSETNTAGTDEDCGECHGLEMQSDLDECAGLGCASRQHETYTKFHRKCMHQVPGRQLYVCAACQRSGVQIGAGSTDEDDDDVSEPGHILQRAVDLEQAKLDLERCAMEREDVLSSCTIYKRYFPKGEVEQEIMKAVAAMVPMISQQAVDACEAKRKSTAEKLEQENEKLRKQLNNKQKR